MIRCWHCRKILACDSCYWTDGSKTNYIYIENRDLYYCYDCDKLNYSKCITCNELIHENDIKAPCHLCGEIVCSGCIIFPYIIQKKGSYKVSIMPYCKGCVTTETTTITVAKPNIT